MVSSLIYHVKKNDHMCGKGRTVREQVMLCKLSSYKVKQKKHLQLYMSRIQALRRLKQD